MNASTLLDIAARSGGIARRKTLLRAGARDSDIRRAVADGALLRVRNGVFAASGTPALVVEAAAHGGAVACVSTLRLFGVWVWDDAELTHVWLGASGRRHEHERCRCDGHHDGGDAAFGVDSGLESILRPRLHRRGIALESQVQIPRVGVVDFVLDRSIILEVDGRDYHDGASLRHKDLRRDSLAAAQGYETLRFDYALVLYDWPLVERAILARRETARHRSARRSAPGVPHRPRAASSAPPVLQNGSRPPVG
ncbi:DUF559 domain-containing protein [Microbacterium enclense]|uniref:DUF559 domain-containing protein n=1 Tax=Microbacterium enclense TaxID=993073 RepID=UPI0036DF09C9